MRYSETILILHSLRCWLAAILSHRLNVQLFYSVTDVRFSVHFSSRKTKRTSIGDTDNGVGELSLGIEESERSCHHPNIHNLFFGTFVAPEFSPESGMYFVP